MDLLLTDKIIVVTGGALGIGSDVVRLLAAEGAIPVIVGRDEGDNLNMLRDVEAKGARGYQVVAELTLPEECERATKEIAAHFGRIDGLVNDGLGLESGSYARFVASLHKNLIHYYLMAMHALPLLIASKGVIVNITSKTAETGQGHTSGYAASNGGRNAMTREWAGELLPYVIRVNAVAVAECFTPMYKSWISTQPDPEAKLKAISETIPLGKRMTTGQIVHVDGGYVHLDRALS